MLKPETVKLVVSEWLELQLPSNYIGVWGRLGIFFQENVLVFKKKNAIYGHLKHVACTVDA